MRPTSYTVVLTNSGLTTVSPSDGFIDPARIEQYMAAGSSPTTYEETTAKRRGNVRWKWMTQKLSVRGNVFIPHASIMATGGSATASPSELQFILQIEAGDESLYTADEENPSVILTGIPAIKRMIARAMVAQQTNLLDIHDPTVSAPVSEGYTGQNARRGTRMENTVVGRLSASLTTAESAITVTAIQ